MSGTLTKQSSMSAVAEVRAETMIAINTAMASGDMFSRDLAIADGLIRLREAFTTDVIAKIASLGGTAIGWRHDLESRRDGPARHYPPDVIRDCAIEALLRGLSLTGNQFNIIAGRCYVTREGYSALLAGYPGLTGLEKEIGLPEDGRAFGKQELVYVTAAARCTVNGKPISVECRKTKGFDGRLAVKTFAGEIDNAKGKAERRLLKLLYERITGSVIDEPDDGVEQAASVHVIEHQQEAAEAPAVAKSAVDTWEAERALLKAPRAQDAWQALVDATDADRVYAIMGGVGKIDATAQDKLSLERFATHRLAEMDAAQAAAS